MKEFIKNHNKIILILSFSLVFTIGYYISIVGAGVIITNPETAVKASLLKTVTGKPLEVKIAGSLNSIGLLPEADHELMSMILDDLIVDSIITYDHSLEAIDFTIALSSISYGKSILEVVGFSSEDRVYFNESEILKGDYYFLTDPITGDTNFEDLIDDLFQEVSRVGLKEYTTTSGDKSYANVFEVTSHMNDQDIFMEILVNNKMEIVHLRVLIENDLETVIDFEADTLNVNRDLISFDVSEAKEFDTNELLDMIPEM